jgi:hypothetical protein
MSRHGGVTQIDSSLASRSRGHAFVRTTYRSTWPTPLADVTVVHPFNVQKEGSKAESKGLTVQKTARQSIESVSLHQVRAGLEG